MEEENSVLGIRAEDFESFNEVVDDFLKTGAVYLVLGGESGQVVKHELEVLDIFRQRRMDHIHSFGESLSLNQSELGVVLEMLHGPDILEEARVLRTEKSSRKFKKRRTDFKAKGSQK